LKSKSFLLRFISFLDVGVEGLGEEEVFEKRGVQELLQDSIDVTSVANVHKAEDLSMPHVRLV